MSKYKVFKKLIELVPWVIPDEHVCVSNLSRVTDGGRQVRGFKESKELKTLFGEFCGSFRASLKKKKSQFCHFFFDFIFFFNSISLL